MPPLLAPSTWAIQIPLLYVLAEVLGHKAQGVWWAYAIGRALIVVMTIAVVVVFVGVMIVAVVVRGGERGIGYQRDVLDVSRERSDWCRGVIGRGPSETEHSRLEEGAGEEHGEECACR